MIIEKYFADGYNGDFALFGYPLGHSISPEIQEKLFALNECVYDYELIEIPPQRFDTAVRCAANKLRGFNCTIPYKTAIIAHLDEISPSARDIGAVNTVKCENGKLYGYNTDVLGFSEVLEMDKVTLHGKNVLVLGYGGVSRMMAFKAAANGGKVTICGRNIVCAEGLANELSLHFGIDVKSAKISEIAGRYEVILNGTPVGMSPNPNECAIELEKFTETEYVFDTIYNPPQTKLLSDAKKLGIKHRGGMSMLVLQAAYAQKIWTGAELDGQKLSAVGAMYILARHRLEENWNRENIILTGFMGSGKTTIGKLLAQRLDMNFYDMDELIEKRYAMSIADIFAHFGEEHFRNIESELCEEFCDYKNAVTATGGGAVLREENADTLHKCGMIVYLDPGEKFILENLTFDSTRPLLRDDPHLYGAKRLIWKRKPSYERCADVICVDDGTMSHRTDSVVELI